MSQFLPKLAKYVPLWQRNLPLYPAYWKGNPQLRVFLPLFWMKMVKSERNLPPDTVKFEVHHQMTKFDVKNYLEKIYGVKVISVRCLLQRGESRKHPTYGFDIHPGPDTRIAWVQVDGEKFEFPDLFGSKETEEEKSLKEMKRNNLENQRAARQEWSRLDLPPWFR